MGVSARKRRLYPEKMPEYADIYVLSRARTRPAIEAFLQAFVPEREEGADEYEVPQYSNSPTVVFKKADELIDHCCCRLREAHAIYWRAVGGRKPEHAMVFFLQDEHIIFGVSTDAIDEAFSHTLLQRLKKHFSTEEALLRYEECPPETADAFRKEL